MKKIYKMLVLIALAFETNLTYAQYLRSVNTDTLHFFNGEWHQKFSNSFAVVDSSQIIVRVSDQARKSEFVSYLTLNQFVILDSIPPFYLCSSTSGQSFFNAMGNLRSSSYFAAVTYNKLGFIDSNDPRFEAQKYLSGLNIYPDLSLANSWEQYTYGNKEIIVAVIDIGFNFNHEDLGYGADSYENVWKNTGDSWNNSQEPQTGNLLDDDGNGYIDDYRGWDFYYNDNNPNTQYIEDPSSVNYHGNCVAGIIGAKTNNGVGIAGIAGGNGFNCGNSGILSPSECGGIRLMMLNVGKDYINFDDKGVFNFWHLAKALVYAAQNGARIVNMSLSGPEDVDFVGELITDIKSKYDITFIGSAGNEQQDKVLNFPANHPMVYGVSGVNYLGNHQYQIGDYLRNKKLDFVSYVGAVPSTSILSRGYNEDFGQTSSATPQVSGVFALLYSMYPCATDHLVYEIMKDYSNKTGAGFDFDGGRNSNLYGYGWPDITASLEALSAKILTSNQHVVSSNVSFSQVWLAKESITIQAGGVLTIASELYMSEGTSIIVNPGGKLIIDGGYIGSGCGWEGIKVYGDPVNVQSLQNCGLVEVKNGGRIENARIGIESINKGIVQTKSGAKFKNNLESVVFTMGIHKGGQKLSSIEATHFISTGPYVAYIGTPNRKRGAKNFIRLDNINGVRVTNSTFENQYWEAPAELQAITGFKVANLKIENNFFSNVERGIYLTSFAGVEGFITVKDNLFENTNRGVQIFNADVRIESNSFAMTRAQQGSALARFGIYTHGCINRISGNIISLNSSDVLPNQVNGYGIIVRNSRKIAESYIDRNQINDIRYGTQVEQNNSKLQISCNDYSNNTVHAWSVNPTFSGTLPEQGSGLEGPNRRRAGNLFFDRNLDANSLRHIRSGIAFTYNAAINPIEAKPQYNSSSIIVSPFNESNVISCGTTTQRGVIACNEGPCSLSQLEFRINSANTDRDSVGIYQLEYLRQAILAENYNLASSHLYGWSSNIDQVLNEYGIETAIHQENWVKGTELLGGLDTSIIRNVYYKRFYEIMMHKLKYEIMLDSLTANELVHLQQIASTSTDVADLAKMYLNINYGGNYALEPEQWQTEGGRGSSHGEIGSDSMSFASENSGLQLEVYPNPSSDEIDFAITTEIGGVATIRVFDMHGRLVLDKAQFDTRQVQRVNIRNLPEGIYSSVIELNQTVVVRKILVIR